MPTPKKKTIKTVQTPLVVWVAAKIMKRQKVNTLEGIREWITKQKDSELYVAVPYAIGSLPKQKHK